MLDKWWMIGHKSNRIRNERVAVLEEKREELASEITKETQKKKRKDRNMKGEGSRRRRIAR